MTELQNIANFHDNFNHDKVILAYDGVLSKDIISAFLDRLRMDIEKTDVPKKEKKRFYSILVECIQNLSKHGNVSSISDKHFLVIVENENDTLKVSTGNVIDIQKESALSELINTVNEKNKAELNEMYRHGIVHNELSKSGEASLGLIDIARKSTNKLKYRFKKIDETTSFFLFQTQIRIAN